MSDHLWPARAEYLRRGTPIQLGICGLAVVLRVEGDEVYVFGDRDKGGAGRMIGLVKEVLLDLRNVTARAHAAWAYTARLGGDLIDVLYGAMADDIEGTKGHKGVLLLAAHGYEPPADVLNDFIALLRAALAWAEGTVDSASGPCPDGGACHHACGDGPCFRVRYCGPLSGTYPGDIWPDEVKRAHATPERGVRDRPGWRRT